MKTIGIHEQSGLGKAKQSLLETGVKQVICHSETNSLPKPEIFYSLHF